MLFHCPAASRTFYLQLNHRVPSDTYRICSSDFTAIHSIRQRKPLCPQLENEATRDQHGHALVLLTPPTDRMTAGVTHSFLCAPQQPHTDIPTLGILSLCDFFTSVTTLWPQAIYSATNISTRLSENDAARLKVQVCQPSPTSCAGQMHLLLSPHKAHFLWSRFVVTMNGP